MKLMKFMQTNNIIKSEDEFKSHIADKNIKVNSSLISNPDYEIPDNIPGIFVITLKNKKYQCIVGGKGRCLKKKTHQPLIVSARKRKM